MIVFNLHCKEGHRFEGWFGSAKDYASQKKRGLLSCPSCGGTAIERGLCVRQRLLGLTVQHQRFGQHREAPRQRQPHAARLEP